jgi:hypothetical protein
VTADLWVNEGYVGTHGLHVFPRSYFASRRFIYKDGQHVVFGGPTGWGKTELAFDLLGDVSSVSCPAYVAVTKPDDDVSSRRGAELGFRRVDQWPPQKKLKETKPFGHPPRGYLIWPQFGDIENDTQRASEVTADLLAHTYANGVRKKHAILVMDDTMVKAKVLGLDGKMVTILAMAGAMGIGLWVFVQKPTDSGRTTLWAFENATHLFLTKGGDKHMLDRYVEIAGEKGAIVRAVVPTLKEFQFLYIHKREGWMCIVDAS